MNPVRSSLKYPQVTLILTLMLFSVGIYALMTMPRREDPKITIRVGQVVAYYPGASPEQVEKQVTKKIEERLFRFEEVRKEKTFSTSRSNVGIINVELEEWVKDTDAFWSKLRHDLNEVRARDLPQGVRGPIVNADFGDVVAVLLAVQGDRYGYRELKDYLERIEDEMRTVRAVSKIKRYGEQKEQIYITSTLERISQYSVTLPRIIGALQSHNIIEFAGRFEAGNSKIQLQTSGLFQTEDQIRKLMVDVSPAGQPVYVGDIGQVQRRYQDPDNATRLNGKKCLMLSIEMQEGNNIVEFGDAIRAKLDKLRPQLPPDLKITLLANQPLIVKNRITHFIAEFGIAIAAVILMTMLLLPFRVATIAALAIPVTVSVTFAALNALGIELHQVSISALIVVLGMVVDDAIVIADSYVELLDRGVPRPEAAWRCASELAIPVLTATLTIIASFAPLALLTGSVGEFIVALPVAVAVALASSYVIAMLLTPLLCRHFILSGLHGKSENGKKKSFSLLDLMQQLYEKVIRFAMAHRISTVIAGALAFAGGMVLLVFVPSQFFPSAERDQFIIDVWLPEASSLEATDRVLQQAEGYLGRTAQVDSYGTFLGSSAPRFYYNVSPEQPATNYGQILVNTKSADVTPSLVYQLRRELPRLCPEAHIRVRELQQGQSMQAPVEVRVIGEDLVQLKNIGGQIGEILRDTPGAAYVFSDYREDSYKVMVDLNDEIASRTGLTNVSIARQLAGSFEGAVVSTFWEGNRAVDIILRLDENRRQSFDNIRSTYLTSNITGARLPLREVANLKPEWQTSRIIRRNGIRTLTVHCDSGEGFLASTVLKAAKSKIDALEMPQEYRIEYGGEYESRTSTFKEMEKALAIGLIAIYLILLIQFRSITEPLVVMTSVPLALAGAALGLILTRNPFGFTAYLGIVGLSGIVVRNAIILIDCINEQRAHGAELEIAALEAGRRRLRPIFLTTVAAAVGVIPMILSGSSLWSPLASVIAVGLLCSMVFTLVVVPVLFVLVRGRQIRREKGQPQ